MNNRLSFTMGRASLTVRKYSPEILLGAGIVGGIVAAILAVKATPKALEEIVTTKINKDKIDDALENEVTQTGSSYSEIDHRNDLGRLYIQSGFRLLQIYSVPLGLGVSSIVAILASHGIMKKREVALYAAYNMLQEGWLSYRKRVVDELGEEADKDFRLGLHDKSKYEYVDDPETGKKTRIQKKFKEYDPNFKSVYARFFDETSNQWMDSHEDNLMFLRTQQQFANDKLRANGHIFLNEVYDMLGIPRSQAGAIVGWISNPKPDEGDKFVDFDLLNPYNAPGRDFINGYNTQGVLLDFNVQGVIYHMI